jgi:hypothetical protein
VQGADLKQMADNTAPRVTIIHHPDVRQLMITAEKPMEIYKVGLASVRFLLAVGDLLIGWRLLARADLARAAPAASSPYNDEAFYQAKIATARFFDIMQTTGSAF